MTGIEYDDFIDTTYAPADDDLRCRFYLEPADGMSPEAAASRVASESSNGTWAALDVDADVERLSALAFGLEPIDPRGRGGEEAYLVDVAYPAELFEAGSLAQILSCIAGNIMGMKAVDRIRLDDCEWPATIVEGFPGPQYGVDVKRELLDADDRPVTATVPKPKVGLPTDAHVEVGRQAWHGGIDLLKDDENLTDQGFNPFEDRLVRSLEERDRAEEATGERKGYLINVTAETDEMIRRAELVADHGGRFVMVDVITAGWSSVQTVREHCEDLGLAIHAHRAMHAAFDRLPTHGVSMRCLAQFSRLAGVDHLHTGTVGLGKLANEDTLGINEWLTGDCHGLRGVLPVASGGLHPGLMPALLDHTGTEIAVQAGGGIHGHPDGTGAGARAFRAAVDAAAAGEPIEDRADAVPELAVALEKWGTETPR